MFASTLYFSLTRLAFDDRLELTIHCVLHVTQMVRK